MHARHVALASIVVAFAVLALAACGGPNRNFVDGSDASDAAFDTRGDGTSIDGAPACTSDLTCDDRIACTIDHCRAGVCSHDACTDCCPSGTQCIAGYGCGQAPTPCTGDGDCTDSVRCTLDRCRADHVCEHLPQEGLCASGEVCLAALGCIPRPPATCRNDADCTMTPCLGTWFCDAELGCEFRSLTNCDDGDACTSDTCSDAMGGCHHAPRDTDGDSHGAMTCGGDDCDDANAMRFPGATETCANGVDENCNGMVDEGCCVAGLACTTSCGTTGMTTCSGPMTPGPCAPPMEVCNGRDDNCDGRVDESCCTAGMMCTTTCGSIGMTTCTSTGMPGPCTPPAESCNGVDDDCDGAADQTFACIRGSTAACMTSCGSIGMRTCGADCSNGLCTPPAETCNGRDDDCDGVSDNGFACVAGSMGTCTTACGSMGTRMCLGSCAWDTCAPPAESCNGRDDNCDGRIDEGCCTPGGPCTTACGSTGIATCNPDGTPGACTPPAETCNGRDDNCDGVADETFACVRASTSPCLTACGSMGSSTCSASCTNGVCFPPVETCNGRDDDCDGTRDNGFACIAGTMGSCPTSCGSTGTRTCLGSCAWDTCIPPAETCNGVDDNCNATCDEGFTCCAGSTRDCTALGFVSGTAVCRANCSGFDTTTCSNCGNRMRDTGEQCDGSDLGTATCVSLGFGGGTLRCAAGCTYDTTGCSPCGNARIDPGETCDGTNLNGRTCATLGMGFTGGTLRCNSLCTAFDTTMCTSPFDPTGTWVVSPGVNYYCGFGAVSYSFGNLTFTDTGSGLSVSGGNINCTMSGPSSRTSRMVNVTCSLPGGSSGCTETYTLTGSYTDDNHFSGTFRSAFSGSGCFGCTTQMFTVTASH